MQLHLTSYVTSLVNIGVCTLNEVTRGRPDVSCRQLFLYKWRAFLIKIELILFSLSWFNCCKLRFFPDADLSWVTYDSFNPFEQGVSLRDVDSEIARHFAVIKPSSVIISLLILQVLFRVSRRTSVTGILNILIITAADWFVADGDAIVFVHVLLKIVLMTFRQSSMLFPQLRMLFLSWCILVMNGNSNFFI